MTDTMALRAESIREAAEGSSCHSDTTAVEHTRYSLGENTDQRDAAPPRIFVPPANQHRCLVLCFDGTGDQFDADNSNIVQLVSALKKDDRTKQMVYYQSGIGTYTSPKIVTPVATKISLILDAMIAWNLGAHVMAGYEFLMQNYTANDRICIFGFSRGAYIARSLAGMIHKVGLLPVDNHQQVPFAYKMYKRTDATGWAQSTAFKKAFCNDVNIDFLGVWDTVDSVGLIPRRLPFTASNTIVRTFRHAISLDERRAKFKPNLWNFPSDEQKIRAQASPRVAMHALPKHHLTFPRPAIPVHFKPSTASEEDMKQSKFEIAYDGHRAPRKTDVLEVWFAGCHCDVGGGSVRNGTRHSLARIPLRWMIRECFKADTGMMFDVQRLDELGFDPASLYPVVRERPPTPVFENARIAPRPPRASWLRTLLGVPSHGHAAPVSSLSPDVVNCTFPPATPMDSEVQEDIEDALSPMYDQLHLNPLWWILEVIPMRVRSQRRDGQWVSKLRANLGRPRTIPHQRPHEALDADRLRRYDREHKPPGSLYVHRSVKTRLSAHDDAGRYYVHRAYFRAEPHWVD